MISRAILLSAVMGWSGSNLIPPTEKPPTPLTAQEIRDKGRTKSVSNVCNKKRKSKTVKELCERWEQHNA